MLAIWQAAVAEFDQGADFVLATIVSVRGSSPRHVGTRFLVRSDGSIVGTIGGGLLEARVLNLAKVALQEKTSHRAHFRFSGKDALATEMICGGEVEVLIELIDASDTVARRIFSRLGDVTQKRGSAFLHTLVAIPQGGHVVGGVAHLLVDAEGPAIGGFPGDEITRQHLPGQRLLKPAQLMTIPGLEYPVFVEWFRARGTVYIFGAGHVGLCVAHLAAYVDFRVVVLDDRAELVNTQRIPEADETLVLDSFERSFDRLLIDEESYVVIVTRGHAHDKVVLGKILRTNAGYVGMIGSRRKTNLVYQALLDEGLTREDLNRVRSPIGLPIGGESPEEIGVSIVAEMVQVRSRKDQLQRLDTDTTALS